VYAIIESFLSGTSDWQSSSYSHTPSGDPYLSQFGGVYAALQNSQDTFANDLSQVLLQNAEANAYLVEGASPSVFYGDFVLPGTDTFVFDSASMGQVVGSSTVVAGHYLTKRFKLGGPVISSVTPFLANGPGLVVPSGANITINGSGFSGATTAVYANNAGLNLNSVSGTQISAFLPGNLNGLIPVTVVNSAGFDTVNIMAAQPSVIAATPQGLRFSYTPGGQTPASQSIQITNAGGGTLTWSATAVTASGGNWLLLNSTAGTAPSTINASVSPAGLAPGAYNGSIQITSAGASNSPARINVTLTISAPPSVLSVSPLALTFTYTMGGTTPPGKSITITNTGGGTLNWTASTSNPWLFISPISGTAPSNPSISVNAAGLASGMYSGTITVSSPGSNSWLVQVSLTVSAAISGPQVSSGGIIGAGLSTPPVSALSSNAIASIFGTSFAPAGTARQVGSGDLVNGLLPTVVDGVCVFVNNVAAPIFALYSNQINFQVPQVLSSGTVGVQVATSCGTSSELRSASQQVSVAAATPEFFYFTNSSTGNNPIAAVNAITGNYIGPAGLIPGLSFVPTVPGDILTLYFTGGGATNPGYAQGQLPNSAANVAGVVGISIGGVQLSSGDILYVGVTPGSAGLYQANIQVPTGAQPGNQPVILTIGGASSPVGYLLIGPAGG